MAFSGPTAADLKTGHDLSDVDDSCETKENLKEYLGSYASGPVQGDVGSGAIGGGGVASSGVPAHRPNTLPAATNPVALKSTGAPQGKLLIVMPTLISFLALLCLG